MKPIKTSVSNQKQKRKTMTKTRRMSTKQLKVQSAPLKSNSTLSQILIVLGIAIVIILGIMLYRFGTVGKALEAPPVQALNLDLQESEEINVEGVPSLEVQVTPSGSESIEEYSLELTKKDDGSISYVLKDATDLILAQELLNDQLGVSDVYLPGDEKVDLKISYGAPYLKIVNTHFEPAKAVDVIVLDESNNEVVSPFLFLKDSKAHFVFNATSSALPTLSAAWEDGTPLGDDVFKIIPPIEGDTFTQATLDWNQEKDGAYVFFVTGKVGDQEPTVRRYVLSLGGVLFSLDQKDLPAVSVKQIDLNTIAVTYSFAETANPQPFSLPCGKATLVDGTISDNVKSKIDKISSYEGGVEQWAQGVPSNFNELESNKGYFLQRRTSKGELSFTVQCKSSNGILPPDATPSFSLPALKKGWNLIGISGYEPIAVGKLKNSLPPYTAITQLYSITLKGVDTMSLVTELQPGRAYWVKVQ